MNVNKTVSFLTRRLVCVSSFGVHNCSWRHNATGGSGGLGTFGKTAKAARVFGLELNKIRTDIRRSSGGADASSSAAVLEECLRTLRQSPLEIVQGLDVRLLSQYLAVLEALAVPSDDATLHSAAGWLRQQAGGELADQQQRLQINSLGQCLVVFCRMGYEDSHNLLALFTPLIRVSLPESATPVTAALLEVAIHASNAEGAMVPLTRDIITTQELRQASMTPSEMLQVVRLILESDVVASEEYPRSVATSMLIASSRNTATSSFVDNVSAFIAAVRLQNLAPNSDLTTDAVAKVCEAAGARIVDNEMDLHSSPQLLIALLQLFTALRGLPTTTTADGAATIQVFQLVERVLRVVDPRSFNLETFCAMYAAASSATRWATSLATKLQKPDDATLTSCSLSFLPSTFDETIAVASTAADVAWTTPTLRHLLPALAVSPAHQDVLARLCAQRLAQLDTLVSQRTAVVEGGAKSQDPTSTSSSTNVTPADLLPLLYPAVIAANEECLLRLIFPMVSVWSIPSTVQLLVELSNKNTKEAKSLLRAVAPKLVALVPKFTPTQLSIVAGCFGRTNVRHEELCEQFSVRAAVLVDELTLHHISVILSSLAAVEYRSNRAFLDLAPRVRELCRDANTIQITNLIAAFARVLVWNFNLFAAMADRAYTLREGLAPVQMITILSAFCRMGFSHDELIAFILARLQKDISGSLSLYDCVQLAFTASITSLWTTELFDKLGERFIRDQSKMDAALLSEALFSFARVGLKQHSIFDQTAIRALSLAPSCPPLATAHMVQAYALIGRKNEEIFAIFSDRLLAARDTFPAVVIAAILNAFAQLGIQDDRLFIEMVPRIRHVATYGCPQDVANAVRAYSTAKLWHYKLFVRLADRAIQIRGECRAQDMIAILSSYARVEMRYEKLFMEFAPRIQALAHILIPSEIYAIVGAYGKVKVYEPALLSTLADRVVELVDVFEEGQLDEVMVVYREAAVGDQEALEQAYEKRKKQQGQGTAGGQGADAEAVPCAHEDV